MSRFIRKQFLEAADWDVQKIYRASGAAGPLAEWMPAVVEFARILRELGPMRKEVRRLARLPMVSVENATSC